jgi:hypothetical protein
MTFAFFSTLNNKKIRYNKKKGDWVEVVYSVVVLHKSLTWSEEMKKKAQHSQRVAYINAICNCFLAYGHTHYTRSSHMCKEISHEWITTTFGSHLICQDINSIELDGSIWLIIDCISNKTAEINLEGSHILL